MLKELRLAYQLHPLNNFKFNDENTKLFTHCCFTQMEEPEQDTEGKGNR